MENIEIVEKLGKGVYGDVFSCKIKNENYAIKIYKKSTSIYSGLLEVNILKSCTDCTIHFKIHIIDCYLV